MKIHPAVAAALLGLATPSFAQGPAPEAPGSALKAEVAPLASAAYEAVNTREARRVSALVRRSPVWVGSAHGADFSGSFHGRFGRIVAESRTESGPHAVEFYFVDGRLRFVYETAEYFEDGGIETGWKNFRGFRAWERRIWFGNDGAAYVESNGTPPTAPPTPAQVLAASVELLRFMTVRLPAAP